MSHFITRVILAALTVLAVVLLALGIEEAFNITLSPFWTGYAAGILAMAVQQIYARRYE